MSDKNTRERFQLAENNEMNIVVTKHSPVNARNKHYITNREPLLQNLPMKLPMGSVRPRGWL